MSGIIIDTIRCVPDYVTTNRANVANAGSATNPFTLYSSATPPTPEGGDGTASASCATFRLNLTLGAKLPITISGTCPALATTLKTQFVLKAVWNGTVILTSDVLPSPGTPNFTVTNVLDWVGAPPSFPCRIGGNWRWFIYPPGVTSNPVATSPTMLLELSFVWGLPPNGPLNPTSSLNIARPDFRGSYPADLLRLFLPSITDMPAPGVNPGIWYLTRSMQTIWNLGLNLDPRTAGTKLLMYDIIRGAPSYVENQYGGVFQLRRFIATVLPLVNCYDLAGIAQLAVALIQTPAGGELLDSRWIFCDKFGYIREGPLIGWPQYNNCNSPFFYQGLPNVPQTDPSRTSFANHAWVEVSPDPANPTARTVLDATHCLKATPNAPAAGTQNRDQYLNAQIDTIPAPPNPSIQTFAFNPASRLPLIGVTSPGALTAFATSRPMLGDPTPPDHVNNAPCDAESLLSVVQEVVANAEVEFTDTLVSSSGCQTLTTFAGLDSDGYTLSLEVSSFENLTDAAVNYQELESCMVGVTDAQHLLPIDSVGDQALRSLNCVLWRRGALVVRCRAHFTIFAPDTRKVSADLLAIATLFDKNLKAKTVRRGLEGRPHPSLREGESLSVPVGSPFRLHLDDVGDANDVRIAESDDPSVVLPKAPGNERGRFEFYALKEGSARVRLCVAHKSKLSVAYREIYITVTEPEEPEE